MRVGGPLKLKGVDPIVKGPSVPIAESSKTIKKDKKEKKHKDKKHKKEKKGKKEGKEKKKEKKSKKEGKDKKSDKYIERNQDQFEESKDEIRYEDLPIDDGLTEAQRRFKKVQMERQKEIIDKNLEKGHRQKIE